MFSKYKKYFKRISCVRPCVITARFVLTLGWSREGGEILKWNVGGRGGAQMSRTILIITQGPKPPLAVNHED